MTYEEWKEKYKPVQNHLVKDAAFGRTMFETYGDEVKYVLQQPCKDVWTLLDNNDGEPPIIVPGYSYVNRIGYFICKVQYEGGLMDFFEVVVE